MLYSLRQTLHPAANDRPWPVAVTADMRNYGICASAPAAMVEALVGATSCGIVADAAIVKPFGGIDADTKREGEDKAGGPGETLR